MTKLLAIFLTLAMPLGDALPARAQATADSTASRHRTTGAATAPTPDGAECEELGRSAGRATPAWGALAVGFVSGVTFGPVGTAIAWAAQGEPDPSKVVDARHLEDAQCRLAYAGAYRHEGRTKKRGAVVLGGVLGTATLLTIAVEVFTHNTGVIP